MSICIVYLASPRSFTYGKHRRIDVLHRSISIVKKTLSFDILVFHEDYTEDDIARFPSDVSFIKIDFKGHESKHTYTKHRYGYLMMCRFFSGILQSHEALQCYSHYMRLDDDSFFMNPLITNEKLLSFLNYDYVYRTTFTEEGHDQTALRQFTKNFLLNKNLSTADLRIGFAPYNNFHVSSLSLWKHPLVLEFINAIEQSNGCLANGFLDANIHAEIIWVLARHLNIKVKNDYTFGYRHNHHVSRLGNDSYNFVPSLSFMPLTNEVENSNDYV